MSISYSIDHFLAEYHLTSAFEYSKSSSFEPKSRFSGKIKQIILGSHKTYRYMLITALLAKTTNNKVDPIAIQAKADMDGAFDARSLCHKVLVPFEKQFLNNALGGSNEPYLNKPARFKSISLTNAVRAGKDRAILVLLVEILSQVEDSNEASELLKKLYILFS